MQNHRFFGTELKGLDDTQSERSRRFWEREVCEDI